MQIGKYNIRGVFNLDRKEVGRGQEVSALEFQERLMFDKVFVAQGK